MTHNNQSHFSNISAQNLTFDDFGLGFAMRSFLFASIIVITLFSSQFSHAQIVPTARIELSNVTYEVDIGSYIYLTPDPEGVLDYQSIITKHQQNLRGARQDSAIINLGIGGDPHWMLFSVTNHTDQEEWILDFGRIYDGRSGFLQKLFIKNHTLNQDFVSLGGSEHTNILSNMTPHSAHIQLAPHKTNLIAISMQMDSGFLNSIRPSLKSANQYLPDTGISSLMESLTGLFFMMMAGFFLAVGYIRQNPNYLIFSAFYILSGLFFILLEHSFFQNQLINTHFVDLIFFASLISSTFATKGFLKIDHSDETDFRICTGILVVLCVSFLLKTFFAQYGAVIGLLCYTLPVMVCFLALSYVAYRQSHYEKFGAVFLSVAWLFPAIGFLLSGLSANGLLGLNALFMNAYWLSLFGHAGFFIAATIQKIQMLDEEVRMGYVAKSKKALQKAKAIQERESADQAKLLRVIERERELMTGLRELEIHRAEEMRRAKEEADDANRAKSAFLAVVSHEVRTPMTGILGMVRLLLGSKLNSEQNEFVLALQKSGETMMALLNDILDFEKIETGNMELEYMDFDLPQLVKDVVTLMSGHAVEKGITLTYEIEDGCPPYVLGDPTRLRQVFLNLVNNAIKFTPEGGVSIILRAKPVSEADKASGIRGDYEVYCAVQDTGIGISEEAQAMLFDPFSQADSSISRKYGGTGLGLTISKKLIEAMGSTICLDSATDEGSTFHFTLLMERGSADLASDVHAANEEKPPLPTKRILVVEDNDMNRKVLGGLLERLGQITTMAESGGDAIDQCKKSAFDMILMDIQLPDMSGVEVTNILRKLTEHNTKHTPIIALTGNVMLDDIKSYYEASMNGFLAKPIDHDKLYDSILNVHNGKLDNPFIEEFEPPPSSEIPALPIDAHATKDHGAEIEQHETPQEDKPMTDHNRTDLLNYAILDSLLTNLGKKQCEELMDGFLSKSDELVALIEKLVPDNDATLLYERAHELKGMAANFGMDALSTLTGTIEKHAKNNDLEKANASIETLSTCNSISKIELLSWLEQAE